MKPVLPVLVLILAVIITNGQRTETITVNGSQLVDFINANAFRYPAFQKGTVHFSGGGAGAGRLNYNYLLQTFQFIGNKTDTLVFADESDIKSIAIGNDTFIHENGFFEQLASGNGLKLARQQVLKIKGEPRKLGAFGISSATLNIPSEDVARGYGYAAKLDVNEEFIFTKKTSYFISAGNSPFSSLNKKSLQLLFPSQAGVIVQYVSEHPGVFLNEADVMNLFAFLKNLMPK